MVKPTLVLSACFGLFLTLQLFTTVAFYLVIEPRNNPQPEGNSFVFGLASPDKPHVYTPAGQLYPCNDWPQCQASICAAWTGPESADSSLVAVYLSSRQPRMCQAQVVRLWDRLAGFDGLFTLCTSAIAIAFYLFQIFANLFDNNSKLSPGWLFAAYLGTGAITAAQLFQAAHWAFHTYHRIHPSPVSATEAGATLTFFSCILVAVFAVLQVAVFSIYERKQARQIAEYNPLNASSTAM